MQRCLAVQGCSRHLAITRLCQSLLCGAAMLLPRLRVLLPLTLWLLPIPRLLLIPGHLPLCSGRLVLRLTQPGSRLCNRLAGGARRLLCRLCSANRLSVTSSLIAMYWLTRPSWSRIGVMMASSE